MSHPSRRRAGKRYVPRPINPNGGLGIIAAFNVAIEDNQPLDPHAMTDLGIAYWASFHVLLHGRSLEENWCTLVCALNVALVLAERGHGKEFEPYIITALDGAFRCKMRADRLHVWRLDGAAITAIREALEVHDEQVQLATKEDLRLALQEVRDRINGGNVYQEAA
jgi:hypothetical protein